MTVDAAKLVRQHALTSALLGVGFVPSYTRAQQTTVEIEAKPNGNTLAMPEPIDLSAGKDRAACEKALAAVRKRYEKDAPHEAFGYSFTNLVWGEGDPAAALMFIGEAPGAEEDKTGRPFVGRAGQLLDKMIVAMGLSRERVYIANVLKVRPPNNATPTIEERAASAPYLFDQIAAINPVVIVTLGLPATQVVLDSQQSMGRMRGQWWQFRHPEGKITVPVMPTYHPAFLLRSYTTENRNAVWSDLRQAMDRLGLPAKK